MIRRDPEDKTDPSAATTMFEIARTGLALDEPAGRFSASATVVGSTPTVNYPAASGPWAGSDPIGLEAPLGESVSAVEPVGEPHEIAASLRKQGGGNAGRHVYAPDPVTGEAFSLLVGDAYGGAETAAHTLRVFHDLALRHRFTFWELLSMLKLETLGPTSLSPDYVDPLLEMEELRSMMTEDARFLRENADLTLEEAVGIWKRAHRYNQLLAQHHPDPVKRARYAEELREREAAMRVASRGRIAP